MKRAAGRPAALLFFPLVILTDDRLIQPHLGHELRPACGKQRRSKRNCQACHTEASIKRPRTVTELDPMLTGPHFNRPEGIIGSRYPGLFPVYVRMPARIVNCPEEPGSLESWTPLRRAHVDSDIREFWPYPRRPPRYSWRLQDLPESVYSYKENPGSFSRLCCGKETLFRPETKHARDTVSSSQ